MFSELRRTTMTVFIEVEKFDGSSEAALGILWIDLVWGIDESTAWSEKASLPVRVVG
jgi:hypothetical protein